MKYKCDCSCLNQSEFNEIFDEIFAPLPVPTGNPIPDPQADVEYKPKSYVVTLSEMDLADDVVTGDRSVLDVYGNLSILDRDDNTVAVFASGRWISVKVQ